MERFGRPGWQEVPLGLFSELSLTRNIYLQSSSIAARLPSLPSLPFPSLSPSLLKAGLLREGEHPWHNKKPRPFPINVPFTGHWPEEDPKVPIRLPGTRVKGTSYLLSPEGRRIQAEYQAQQKERERVGYMKEMYGGVGPGGGARILGPKWVNVPGKGVTARSWKEGETEEEKDDREAQEEEDKEWEDAPEEKV
ncbi:hypothetical protein BDY24DRAFT_422417 [Mrakia frigida]|uniref:uncharacterized protein n=1 Tax=Mrakia frigida TaxID=29902 RepID=UPI003FCBF5E3